VTASGSEPDRVDVRYFKTRLEDPALLDEAVVVEGLLAVPVRGRRRGGFVSLATAESADRAIAALSGRADFPNLRYEFSSYPADEFDDAEEYHIVLWGDDPPELPKPVDEASDYEMREYDIASGRFYGYSEKAIQRYLRKRRA